MLKQSVWKVWRINGSHPYSTVTSRPEQTVLQSSRHAAFITYRVTYLRQLWYQMGFGDVLNSLQMYLRTAYSDYRFLSFLVSVMRLQGTGVCVIACRLIRKLRRVVLPQVVNSITS